MNRLLTGSRTKSFRDKYLALAMVLVTLLIGGSAFGQVDTTKQRQRINAYGYDYKNVAIDSSFRLPQDTFKLKVKDSGALAMKGGVIFVWTGIKWDTASGKVETDAPIGFTGGKVNLSYDPAGLKVTGSSLDAKVKAFSNLAALRALTVGDTGSIYRVRINRDYGEFKYDPDDASSADDSAMVIVDAAGNRFKRVINDVIYPEDFGAKGDGTTDDAAAFNKMYRWIEANARNLKEVKHKNQAYFFASTVYLPGNLPINGKLLKLKIIGNATIYKTTAAITILERWPTSQSQALNEYISDYSLELKGINFEGNSTSGQVGARLGAMYTPVMEGCHFTSLDTGVVAAFWLNGRIKNNFFTLNKSVAFKGASGSGYWSGASTSNSAFNINEFTGNRVFNGNGSYAGLYFWAADGLLIKDHISEGNNPRYDIFNESQAATVVNGNTYRNIWFESVGGTNGSKNTCFFLRNNGTTVIDGLQNDYADTLIEFSNPVSNSEFVIKNIQYYNTTGGKTLNGGGAYRSGINLQVDNCSNSFAKMFLDTAYWVGGVLGMDIAMSTFRPSGAGFTLESNRGINIEPHKGFAATSKMVTMYGGFQFYPDNSYNFGGTADNFRPLRITVGTGGVRVDKTASFGYGFGDNKGNPSQYWHQVNDSTTRIFSTGGTIIPKGTTDQRIGNIGGNNSGIFRYNTTTSKYEGRWSLNASDWRNFASETYADSLSTVRADSIAAHRTRLQKIEDSLFSHNNRIIKNTDSISVHNTRILQNVDSIYSHNNRILKVNDTLYSHNNRLSALENTTGGGSPSSETLVKVNDADYTISTGTGNIVIHYFNELTAARTVTLPDPATNTGRIITIKHGGAGAFNINFSANVYENSSTWNTALAQGASTSIMSDGTQYIKIR